MGWMPGAIHRPVARFNPGGSIAQQITPRRVVFHTAVSAADSLFTYFNQSGNPCSHFYVRADGTVEQYVDTTYRAPAQLDGNHDCIGVETQDMGDGFPAWSGSDVPAWNTAQIAALASLSAWVSATHGIPLGMLPDSVNGRAGFGYHRQGVNPWRVPNGELWSNSTGKVCPGDRRIAQIPQILTQAATGDDMFEEADRANLNRIKQLLEGTSGDRIGDLWTRDGEILTGVTAQADDETNILAAIAALPGGVTSVTDADLVRIATAVNDELARRTAAP